MRRGLVVFLCGFISGFTILISGNTLNFWLANIAVDKTAIGLFSLVSLPYAINVLWAPCLDVIKLPLLTKLLGHRLGWICLLQIGLACFVYAIGMLDISNNLQLLVVCAFMVAFFSATQDVVLGAFRAEVIPQNKQGSVAGLYIFGYRIGMLLSSSGAIWCSVYYSWNLIYKVFALIILCFPLLLYCMSRGLRHDQGDITAPPLRSHSILGFISSILGSIGNTRYVIYILVFLVLYRLPDNFINAMINPFLLEKGFGAIEIASVGKFLGIIAAIIGGFLGSYIMSKISITRSLLLFGLVHAVAHLMFIVQDAVGYNITLLFIVMGFESITGGMAMAAYIAFITSLCSGQYSVSQYSVLSAMMGLSRAILPGISGLIANKLGWDIFYFLTFMMTIPPLMMIRKIAAGK